MIGVCLEEFVPNVVTYVAGKVQCPEGGVEFDAA